MEGFINCTASSKKYSSLAFVVVSNQKHPEIQNGCKNPQGDLSGKGVMLPRILYSELRTSSLNTPTLMSCDLAIHPLSSLPSTQLTHFTVLHIM